MAEEQGLQVDLEEFNNYMNQQRERSRVSILLLSLSGMYVPAGITHHATLCDYRLIVTYTSAFWWLQGTPRHGSDLFTCVIASHRLPMCH